MSDTNGYNDDNGSYIVPKSSDHADDGVSQVHVMDSEKNLPSASNFNNDEHSPTALGSVIRVSDDLQHFNPDVVVRDPSRPEALHRPRDDITPIRSINYDTDSSCTDDDQDKSPTDYGHDSSNAESVYSTPVDISASQTRTRNRSGGASPRPNVQHPRVMTPVRGGRLSLFSNVVSGFKGSRSVGAHQDRLASAPSPSVCQSDFLSRPESSSVKAHDQRRSDETQRGPDTCGPRATDAREYVHSPIVSTSSGGEETSSGPSQDIIGDQGEHLVTYSGDADSHCHTNRIRQSLDKKARTRLVAASLLCLAFMTGEMVGGFIAGSLAIISDAAHLLTDFASFMIALMALYLANKPATKKFSFGWYRAEILGAFISILMLWVLTGILVYSAVMRIKENNYEIQGSVMLITAGTGVAFNILLGVTLHQHTHSHGGAHGHSHGPPPPRKKPRNKQQKDDHKKHHPLTGTRSTTTYGSVSGMENGDRARLLPESDDDDHDQHNHSHESNINVKAAFIHVLGDLFQSVGVLVAAFIIYFKPEWKIADPICTFMFSVFVLITTITIMSDIILVLMEGAPRGINFVEVQEAFLEVEGVLDIHNLRVWSLTMDKVALSVHLAVDKNVDPHRVLRLASRLIQERFGIAETTVQIEEYVTEMDECNDCKGPK